MTFKTNAQLDLEFRLKLFKYLTSPGPQHDDRFLKTHWKYEDAHWFNEHKVRLMRLRPVRAGEYRPHNEVKGETQPTHVLTRKIGNGAHEKMFITLTQAESFAQCDDIILLKLWKASVATTQDQIDLAALIAAHTANMAQHSGVAK